VKGRHYLLQRTSLYFLSLCKDFPCLHRETHKGAEPFRCNTKTCARNRPALKMLHASPALLVPLPTPCPTFPAYSAVHLLTPMLEKYLLASHESPMIVACPGGSTSHAEVARSQLTAASRPPVTPHDCGLPRRIRESYAVGQQPVDSSMQVLVALHDCCLPWQIRESHAAGQQAVNCSIQVSVAPLDCGLPRRVRGSYAVGQEPVDGSIQVSVAFFKGRLRLCFCVAHCLHRKAMPRSAWYGRKRKQHAMPRSAW
jgi:hypothetical protein